MELLVATHNIHKKEEIQQILGDEFVVKSLADYDLHEEIVEDGDSFNANALIKAKYCFEKTGIPSLGDDSGLVVESLDGRPGIFSARYAGNHDPRRTEGIRRSDVYRAADHQAHAEGGGANENRGRLCVGNDRRGAALLLCGGIR